MKIDQDTIQKLAHLARIKIDPGNEKSLIRDMEQILTWIEKLNELDTSQVSELNHMSAERNRFRPDTPDNHLTKQEALRNSPDHDGDFFRVPKVLE